MALIDQIMSFNVPRTRMRRVELLRVANKRHEVIPERTKRTQMRLKLNGSRKFRDGFALVDGEIPRELERVRDLDFENWMRQNCTRLQLIFFGTSIWIPSSHRQLPSLAIRSLSEIWLFDVGEDTQRQCMKHPLTKPGKICRIFLTSLKIETCLGLPGVLCTISASKEKNPIGVDIPIHVYGPTGVASFLMKLMELSDTYLGSPVLIHEFSRKAHSKDFKKLTDRAKLWKVLIPPDAMNKDGFYDARIDGYRMVKKRLIQQKDRSKTIDYRAAFRPFNLPPPGDSSLLATSNSDLMWTIKLNDEFLIKAYSLNNNASTLGYRIIEGDTAGKLDIQKALSHGIQPGPEYGLLKNGGTVTNPNGELITSEMVLGPDKKGRVITILGHTNDSETIMKLSQDADYLILPVEEFSPPDPEQVVELAKRSRVRNLIFGRVDHGDIDKIESLSTLQSKGDEMSITLAFDFYTHVVTTN